MAVKLQAAGIYSIAEAARLVDVPPRRLRDWVVGHRKSAQPPALESELERADGQIALSFVNLVEAHFINVFLGQMPLIRLRKQIEEAKRVLETPHPFAQNALFQTDGARLYLEIAQATGDPHLYDLGKRNFAIWTVLKGEFLRGLEYDASGAASSWKPRRELAPTVVLRPKVAFGAPALEQSMVPTNTLFEAVQAEGDIPTVAKWYGLAENDVEQAIRFEVALRKAA